MIDHFLFYGCGRSFGDSTFSEQNYEECSSCISLISQLISFDHTNSLLIYHIKNTIIYYIIIIKKNWLTFILRSGDNKN